MLHKRSILRKELDAYYTVEASFLVPIVLAVTFFLFYMGLFQYNRCIAEQSIEQLLLLASGNEVEEIEVSKRIEKLYDFPFLSCHKLEIKLEEKDVSAYFTGGIKNYLSNFGMHTKADYFSITLQHSAKLFRPVDFIRTIRKVERYVENGFCE